MTIAHAQSYLARLRSKSKTRKQPTKKKAWQLSLAAYLYYGATAEWPPGQSPAWHTQAWVAEWQRFCVRVYDEFQRLRAIAEG